MNSFTGSGFGIGLIVEFILGVSLCVLLLISLIKIYKKFDQAWWKAIVPIYNIFVLTQMAEKSILYFALFLVPVVNIYAAYVVYSSICEKLGKSKKMAIGILLMPYIFIPMIAFNNNISVVKSSSETKQEVESSSDESYESPTVSSDNMYSQNMVQNNYQAQDYSNINMQSNYNDINQGFANPIPVSDSFNGLNEPVQNIFANAFGDLNQNTMNNDMEVNNMLPNQTMVNNGMSMNNNMIQNQNVVQNNVPDQTVVNNEIPADNSVVQEQNVVQNDVSDQTVVNNEIPADNSVVQEQNVVQNDVPQQEQVSTENQSGSN